MTGKSVTLRLVWLSAVLALGAGCAPAGLDAGARQALERTEAALRRSLDNDAWSRASRAFARSTWADFRHAYLADRDVPVEASPAQAMPVLGWPDVRTYDEYLGRYSAWGTGQAGPFIEVLTDAAGRLRVRAGGGGKGAVEFPAIRWNNSILFTTGTLQLAENAPPLAGRLHATLELILLTRIDGEYFCAPLHDPDRAVQLMRMESPRT